MKSVTHVFVLAVLLLSGLVVAFPHDVRRAAGGGDVVAGPEPVTIVEVTVYVDQNGKTLSVETHTHHRTATATAAVDNAPTSLPPLMPVPDPNAPHQLAPIPVPDHHQHHNHHNRPHGEKGNSNRRFGISYSPYNADGTCKTQSEVTTDISTLTQYTFIRIYGVDCDQTHKVLTATRAHNMHLFAGIWDLSNLESDLQTIVSAVQTVAAGDWASSIHTISIGNELVNRNQNSVRDVVDAVGRARKFLRAAGYGGPVVTIDTFSKMLEFPGLCGASDYCAANCHAFFDATLRPEDAGEYVREQARRISDAAGGKYTLISESGWPHTGLANGVAVPSLENHRVAVESLRRAYWENHGDLVLFSAFDDLWKVDTPWTFGAERFWGIEQR